MKKRILMVFFSLVGVFLLDSASARAAFINDAQCSMNALYGSYYRISAVTDANRSVSPSDPILFANDQLLLQSNDTMGNFQTPQTMERKFPNANALPGQPQYFAAHWHGTMKVPAEKDYRVMLSSHEASQLYINGVLVIDVAPNANLGGKTITTHLPQGDAVIDIFFAKRSTFTSGLVFSIDGVGSFSPCASSLPLQSETGGSISTVVTPSTPVPSTPVVTTPSVLGTNVENRAPHFVAFNPPRTVAPQKSYVYMVVGQDPDQDLMTYRLVNAPAGMTITPHTGFISWDPTAAQRALSPQLVTIEIADQTHVTQLGYMLSVNVPVNNSVLSRNTDTSGVMGKTNSQNAPSMSISHEPAQGTETTASAGNRLFASAFFTGMFNAFRWLRSNATPLLLGIFFFVVAAVIAFGILEVVERAKLARRSTSSEPSPDA